MRAACDATSARCLLVELRPEAATPLPRPRPATASVARDRGVPVRAAAAMMQLASARSRLNVTARACERGGPRATIRGAAPLAAVAPPTVPAGKALADLTAAERVVDVAVAATSNLLNGGIFGAFFGLVSGGWTTRSLGGAFSEAKVNGKSWGGISCIYAGLQTASRVVRNKDDRMNNVVGACGSGAVFSAKNGPRAAAQGCVSFAALSYLIDVFTTPKDSPGPDGAGLSDEAVLRKKR